MLDGWWGKFSLRRCCSSRELKEVRSHVGTWVKCFLGRGRSPGIDMYWGSGRLRKQDEWMSSWSLEKHSWGTMLVLLPENTPNSYVTPHRQPWIFKAQTKSYLETGVGICSCGMFWPRNASPHAHGSLVSFSKKQDTRLRILRWTSKYKMSWKDKTQIWIHTKVKITLSDTSVSRTGFLNSGEDGRVLKTLNTYNMKAGSPQIKLQRLCYFLSDNHQTEIFFLPREKKGISVKHS